VVGPLRIVPAEDGRDDLAGGQSLALVEALLRLVNGSWATQAIAVAAELGLADLLAEGTRNPDQLARATGCHAPSLHRLLRALASLGLCEELEDGTFGPSVLGSLLTSEAPMSLRGMAIYGRYKWPVWGNLLHSVRTGACANALAHGAPVFEHLERDAASAQIFHRAMTETTRLIARAVVSAYDFRGFRRIVDIGGGYGEMLGAILRACPSARGVLLDLPAALEGARRNLEQAGLALRCELVAGDFFESVPGGADCYLLKRVIHDWEDDRATAILRCCRDAMPAGAKLLLVEQIMPERIATSPAHQDAARMDLHMLLMVGGRERTADQYRRVLDAAGLGMGAIVPAALNVCVIEAVPR
jgi:precorrin-6B methylase 2